MKRGKEFEEEKKRWKEEQKKKEDELEEREKQRKEYWEGTDEEFAKILEKKMKKWKRKRKS